MKHQPQKNGAEGAEDTIQRDDRRHCRTETCAYEERDHCHTETSAYGEGGQRALSEDEATLPPASNLHSWSTDRRDALSYPALALRSKVSSAIERRCHLSACGKHRRKLVVLLMATVGLLACTLVSRQPQTKLDLTGISSNGTLSGAARRETAALGEMEQAALCEDSVVYRTPGQGLIDSVGLHDWSLGLTVYDATLAALREAEDDSIILPQIQTESSDDVVLALQSLEAAVRSYGNSFLLHNPDECPFGFCRNNSLIGRLLTDAWPFSFITYLLVPLTHSGSEEACRRARVLFEFVTWLLSPTNTPASEVLTEIANGFKLAMLPNGLRQMSRERLARMTCNGRAISAFDLQAGPDATVVLAGAGPDTAFKFMSRATEEFERATGLKVRYSGGGSYFGMAEVMKCELDFAVSDVEPNAGLLDACAQDLELQMLPVFAAAAALVVNTKGMVSGGAPLRLTPEVIDDILTGNLTCWNHPRILQLNPFIDFPNKPIRRIVPASESGIANAITSAIALYNAAACTAPSSSSSSSSSSSAAASASAPPPHPIYCSHKPAWPAGRLPNDPLGGCPCLLPPEPSWWVRHLVVVCSVAGSVLALLLLLAVAARRLFKRASEPLFSVAWDEIRLPDPPHLLFIGSFAVLTKVVFRGEFVACKRLLPEAKLSKLRPSAFDVSQNTAALSAHTHLPAHRTPERAGPSAPFAGFTSRDAPRRASDPSNPLQGLERSMMMSASAGGGSYEHHTPQSSLHAPPPSSTLPSPPPPPATHPAATLPTSSSYSLASVGDQQRPTDSSQQADPRYGLSAQSAIAYKWLLPSRASLPASLHRRLAAKLQVLITMRHPNLCPIMGACLQPGGEFLLVQYFEYGGVRDLLDSRLALPLDVRMEISLGICSGMQHIHLAQPPLLHLNLKAANVLLDSKLTPKVSDFGMSAVHRGGGLKSESLAWTAPEVLESNKYTTCSDVYAFAVTLWEVFHPTSFFPYPDINPEVLAEGVKAGRIRPEIERGQVPPELVELIQHCWAHRPDARPSFQEIVQHLSRLSQGSMKTFVEDHKGQRRGGGGGSTARRGSVQARHAVRAPESRSDAPFSRHRPLLPPVIRRRRQLGIDVPPERLSAVAILFAAVEPPPFFLASLAARSGQDRLSQLVDERAMEIAERYSLWRFPTEGPYTVMLASHVVGAVGGDKGVEAVARAALDLAALGDALSRGAMQHCDADRGQDHPSSRDEAGSPTRTLPSRQTMHVNVNLNPHGAAQTSTGKASIESQFEAGAPATSSGSGWVRVGCHVGPAVAAVTGLATPTYSLFGPTVSFTVHLQCSSHPGHVQVSEEFGTELAKAPALAPSLTCRGQLLLPGRVPRRAWFLTPPSASEGERSDAKRAVELGAAFFTGKESPEEARLQHASVKSKAGQAAKGSLRREDKSKGLGMNEHSHEKPTPKEEAELGPPALTFAWNSTSVADSDGINNAKAHDNPERRYSVLRNPHQCKSDSIDRADVTTPDEMGVRWPERTAGVPFASWDANAALRQAPPQQARGSDEEIKSGSDEGRSGSIPILEALSRPVDHAVVETVPVQENHGQPNDIGGGGGFSFQFASVAPASLDCGSNSAGWEGPGNSNSNNPPEFASGGFDQAGAPESAMLSDKTPSASPRFAFASEGFSQPEPPGSPQSTMFNATGAPRRAVFNGEDGAGINGGEPAHLNPFVFVSDQTTGAAQSAIFSGGGHPSLSSEFEPAGFKFAFASAGLHQPATGAPQSRIVDDRPPSPPSEPAGFSWAAAAPPPQLDALSFSWAGHAVQRNPVMAGPTSDFRDEIPNWTLGVRTPFIPKLFRDADADPELGGKVADDVEESRGM